MTLKECYDEVAKIPGGNEEPFTVVECVDRHRRFWRPARVHTILLAESHVFTDDDEFVPMKPRSPIVLQGEASEEATPFARFVYCLGYGENDYVGRRLRSNNLGTWQYWKIFSSCVARPSKDSFAQILKGGNPEYENRLISKIALLHRLKEMGVWLIDASVVALYGSGGHKPSKRTRDRIIECCWDSFIRDQIESAAPHSIIVIGRDVKEALCSRLEDLSDVELHYVHQPQSRMSTAQIAETHQLYFDVCRRALESRQAG